MLEWILSDSAREGPCSMDYLAPWCLGNGPVGVAKEPIDLATEGTRVGRWERLEEDCASSSEL